MNILVTGCAGFIGYSFTHKILLNKKFKIFGIDNLNTYYSLKLKNERLKRLKKHKNFKFYKVDLNQKKKLISFFNKYKIDVVFHFAAQAGVWYVFSHPEKFIESNILGFHNLIDVSKHYNIKKFFYASSSSVYGDDNKFPVNENSKLVPKNIYGLSKKMNEEYININSNKSTKYIGLRFFTVFGEWGRPDMLILKFLKSTQDKKVFYLNNNGKHWRDFTYIDDVVKNLELLLIKNFKENTIINICSNRPIYIRNLISYLCKKTNFFNIKNMKQNKIEAIKTHGENKKLKNITKFKKFSDFYKCVDKTIKWFQLYKKIIWYLIEWTITEVLMKKLLY